MIATLGLCLSCLISVAQVPLPHSVRPNPLSRQAEDAVVKLAAENDVLFLGELHGTKEVPALAEALLTRLAEKGYGVLALELPVDEQQALAAWATGKTEIVPDFFAKPAGHGRGNVQVLSLVRTALSQPYSWQLICFDQPWSQSLAEGKKLYEMEKEDSSYQFGSFVKRERRMASNFANERARLGGDAKVLTICGSHHARTSNRPAAAHPDRSFILNFWPSLASLIAKDHPQLRIGSVDIVPCSGEYFAAKKLDSSGNTVGNVHVIRGGPNIRAAVAKPLNGGFWDWELYLPCVTPATFLSKPNSESTVPSEH